MNIIDTHCHINAPQLFDQRDGVIQRAKENGVVALFNQGDSLESFEKILTLEKEYPSLCYSVLGIHPEFALESDDYFERAYRIIEQEKDHIKAIGEIGLDYHYDKSEETKEKQKRRFREQIQLAKKLNLPIVIHSRDADFDTLEIIKEMRPSRFDLHCYSSSAEVLREYVKLGLDCHIGIGGVCTFKNAKAIVNVIDEFPISMFLTETDCPYLAPTPHRGEINEPKYLPLIIQRIAEIKGMEKERVAEELYQNGKDFYGI